MSEVKYPAAELNYVADQVEHAKEIGEYVRDQYYRVQVYDPRWKAMIPWALREAARISVCAQAGPDCGVERAALTKINEIRNSIIGTHTLNWSEHVYPLVAALGEAGFEGMSYPEVRENYGTLVERVVKAEDSVEVLTKALEEILKEVGTSTKANKIASAALAASSLTPTNRCTGADDLEHLDGMLDDRERGA